MKEPQIKPDSDGLSKALQEWRAEQSVPPGFQSAVWQRIDSETRLMKRSVLESLIAWFNEFAARPQFAASTVALLIMIGVTAGWTQGQREVSRVQNQLAQKYLASLDPYQPPK